MRRLLRALWRRLRGMPGQWAAAFRISRVLMGDLGYWRSLKSGRSQARDGTPVPWFTYAAMEYLQQFDFSGKAVFEYGAGNSTLFWAARARRVVAVESDPQWQQWLTAAPPGNVRVIHQKEESAYADAIQTAGGPFDVIVLDGWYRKACAAPALDQLQAGGMIVVDNSDWLPETCRQLREADLIQVDFSSFGPICHWRWTTSVFLSRDFRFPLASARQPMPPAGGIPAPLTARDM